MADIPEKNLLCVFLNPPQHPAAPVRDGGEFEFVGYDLVERATGISALTNCGGFRDVFDNAELTSKGLLANHARAAEVQKGLGANHPQEPHANCDLWAVFRWRGSKPSAH